MDWKSHIQQLMEAGASVDQLADRIGVTGNAVREILAGRTKSPRAEAAMKLAKLKPRQFGRQLAKGERRADMRESDAVELPVGQCVDELRPDVVGAAPAEGQGVPDAA